MSELTIAQQIAQLANQLNAGELKALENHFFKLRCQLEKEEEQKLNFCISREDFRGKAQIFK